MGVYHVLFNPLAGNGTGESKAQTLKTLLNDCELIYHDMTQIGSYEDFFASIHGEDIVICGGDGTLHRFVNETDRISFTGSIYYFPVGTGNDFLRDLERSDENKPVPVDPYLKDLPTVTVNGKTYRFLNNVGFGIDGYCCEVGDKLRNTSDKPVNYTSIAIKGLLFHFKPVNATVTVDGVSHTYRNVWLAPTMNGRYYGGGMMPTPEQDRLDPEGKLSVMVMYKKSKLKTLMVFPSIFKGEHIKHTQMVDILTGHEIHVKFETPCALQIDGETILGVTEYTAHARKPRETADKHPAEETASV